MKCPDPPPCKDCGTTKNLTFDSKQNTICVKCYKNNNQSMTNLEKIQKAWSWGWSAVICIFLQNIPQKHVIGFFGMEILMNNGSHIHKDLINNKNIKITGYKYAGELAGNEPIPDGQEFKLKATNEIGEFSFFNGLEFPNRTCTNYDKSKIEPYFGK